MSDVFDLKVSEKKAKEQEDLRKKELGDIRVLLSRPEFRRVVWRILGYSALFRDPMTGNSQTFYNIGAQKVGRWILNEIFEADPSAYAQIQAEAISAAKSNKEEE